MYFSRFTWSSEFRGVYFSVIQGCIFSGIQGCIFSGIQGCIFSGIQRRLISGIQGCIFSGIQGCTFSGIQGCTFSGIQGRIFSGISPQRGRFYSEDPSIYFPLKTFVFPSLANKTLKKTSGGGNCFQKGDYFSGKYKPPGLNLNVKYCSVEPRKETLMLSLRID